MHLQFQKSFVVNLGVYVNNNVGNKGGEQALVALIFMNILVLVWTHLIVA